MIEPFGVWTYAPLDGKLEKMSESRNLSYHGIQVYQNPNQQFPQRNLQSCAISTARVFLIGFVSQNILVVSK